MKDAANPLTDEQIQTFQRDGVLCVRGVIDLDTCKRMEEACLRLADDPSEHISRRWAGVARPPRGHERIGMALSLDQFREYAFESPLPRLAGALMNTPTVRYFYDQMFIKIHRGTGEFDGTSTAQMATPWHQDLPYWPFDGADILSIWVPFRPVPRDASGLEYVARSHRDPDLYTPFGLKSLRNTVDAPDMDAIRAAEPERFLSWDMEPGDCLIHHPRTLHRSTSNAGENDRVAVSVRYLGRDAIYAPDTIEDLWYPEDIEIGDRGAPVDPHFFPALG
ncbi:phytanoyl-CoA dioxygenase family protein [Sphingobium sp.]|uniref:phytanoyl-CoA dioxygenase family protein n=1 Tax=Sphingobium sp. TaxID=1912891 RepID=UPI0028BDE842|nr:phytanoyl-CoA dioxygenase family protein [Sphingobium sp.]